MSAPSPLNRRSLAILAGVVLLAIGLGGAIGFSEMRKAQRYSNEAALTAKVTRKLAACGERGQFPASLSELQLSYPERSTPSTLRFFEYHTTGTNCTLKVAFPGAPLQEFSFP